MEAALLSGPGDVQKRGYLPVTPDTYDMVLLETLGKPARTNNSVITQVRRSDVQVTLDACRGR